ncbi:MAG: hypothetical protein RL266_2577, partial [Bacteroidota bacterium]
LLLYRNNGNGFEPFASNGLQAANPYYNTCAMWIDHDGDNDLDLGCNSDYGPLLLFERTGNTTFNEVSAMAGYNAEAVTSFSSAWADFDLDGDLDQYVGIRNPSGPQGNRKLLYENNGDGTFTDITDMAMVADSQGITYQVLWTDFDRDGLPDIHIANDKPTNRNVLYKNLGNGTFQDVSDPNTTGMVINGMGIAAADYDNNGFEDLYVTNDTQSTWDFGGNILCQNQGNGTFSEVAGSLDLRVFDLTWGCNFADFDNDGHLDLFVAIEGDFAVAADVIFKNNGDGTFTEILDSGIETAINRSFGSAVGDVNNDVYPDIVVLSQNPDKIFVWQNNGGSNNWVKFLLHGSAPNTQAIGSWVEIYYAGNSGRRYHRCGNSFSSQDGTAEMFGIGQAFQIDSVHVIWPTGNDLWLYDLVPNQTYILDEGSLVTNVLSPSTVSSKHLVLSRSGNSVNVAWQASNTENAQLRLITMDGRIVQSKTLSQKIGYNTTIVDLSPLAPGLYSISLTSKYDLLSGKIMFEK